MSAKSSLRSTRENVNAAYVNVDESPDEAVRRINLAIAHLEDARKAITDRK